MQRQRMARMRSFQALSCAHHGNHKGFPSCHWFQQEGTFPSLVASCPCLGWATGNHGNDISSKHCAGDGSRGKNTSAAFSGHERQSHGNQKGGFGCHGFLPSMLRSVPRVHSAQSCEYTPPVDNVDVVSGEGRNAPAAQRLEATANLRPLQRIMIDDSHAPLTPRLSLSSRCTTLHAP
ncbi:MAG: hypothetical protein JWR15_233 [Prosthecobacter sp.]|nr:hypothetical protein [Prosthecobacter sp.]